MRRNGRMVLTMLPGLLAVAALTLGVGCGSSTKVTRVASDTTIDLSGRWNDADSRMVSEEMIQDCLNRPWIVEHATRAGKMPVVIIGTVRNQTMEQIQTGTFVADMERAFVNSGKVDLVATATERLDLRSEKADQWENASEETVKRLGQERGADYMLSGTVQSIEDREKGTRVIFYQVDLTLLDIETNQKVWIGQKKIKKEIQRSGYSR